MWCSGIGSVMVRMMVIFLIKSCEYVFVTEVVDDGCYDDADNT